jgi:hypothetical protein
MSTITAPAAVRPRRRPRFYLGCHFYDIYTDPRHDDADRAAITDLLLSPAGHHEVFERLAPMGLGVSEKMIERHRRSLCTCGRI